MTWRGGVVGFVDARCCCGLKSLHMSSAVAAAEQANAADRE
jgi:hypothetical protein